MRKHRVIRQEIVPQDTSFSFDIETEQFDALLVTWSAASDNGVVAPLNLIFCPTAEKRIPLGSMANFPVMPAVPVAGAAVYAAVGLSTLNPLPIPQMVTVGVVTPAGCVVTLRIEGDESPNRFDNMNPSENKARV